MAMVMVMLIAVTRDNMSFNSFWSRLINLIKFSYLKFLRGPKGCSKVIMESRDLDNQNDTEE